MRSLLLLSALVVHSAFGVENPKLTFSGNQVFTAQQLQQALNASIDYAFVSHPLATKEEFQKNLAHLLQVAYADRGFADAQITLAPSTPGKWNVQIKEGRQFTCGKVIVPSKENPIAKELANFLSKPIRGYEYNPNSPPSLDKLYQPADWVNSHPARLTRARLQALGWNARLFCYLKGYTLAKVTLVPKPRQDGAVDMQVQMNLGKKQFGPDVKTAALKLSQAQVHGVVANKPEDIIKFLGLQTGMPITQTLCEDLKKKLWDSGRFLAVAARWHKDGKKEAVGIDIHVTECPNTPLLTEAISEQTRQALAIYRSLIATTYVEGQQEWEMQLIIDASKADDLPTWKALLGGNRSQLHAVFAGNKGMGITGSSASGNEPEALRWGGISQTGKETGIFLAGGKVRWVVPDRGKSAGAFINLTLTPSEGPEGEARFQIGGGFSTDRPVPLMFNIKFPPATILQMFHGGKFGNKMDVGDLKSKTTTSDEGIIFDHFTFILSDRSGPKPIAIPTQIKTFRDARDKFQSLQMEMKFLGAKLNFKLSPSKNALNKLTNRLTQETKTHLNEYTTDHGFSTLIGFASTHLLPELYKWTLVIDNKEKPGLLERAKQEAQVQLIRTLGSEIQKAVEPFDKFTPNSPGPFEIRESIFQDQLVTSKVNVDGHTRQIPVGKSRFSISSPHASREFDFQMRRRIDLSSLSFATRASMAVSIFGPIFADDAWPKTINSEIKLIEIHSTQYSEAALVQMVKSEKSGPLACLMAANLLNILDLPSGVQCAREGLKRLNEEGVRLDCQPFTDPNSPMIRTTDHFMETANPILIKKVLDATGIELLGERKHDELLKKLAANQKIKSTEILLPIIADAWKKLIPMIANELQMAQFGSMKQIRTAADRGSAEHQFMLGLMHFQGRVDGVNLVEAYAWASLAAIQSYPNADNLRNAIMKQMSADEILRGMKRSRELKK